MIIRLVFLLNFFFCNQSQAQVFGVDIGVAGGLDMNTILLSNPPLPMLKVKEKTWKLAIQPTYYTGDSNFVGDVEKFKGQALAANFSKGLSKRWGWYSSLSANRFTTDIQFGGSLTTRDSLNDVKVNFLTTGGGLFFQVLEQDGWIPSWTIQAGPFIKWVQMSQNVKKTNINSNENLIDYDMESSNFFGGLLIGGQIGWDVGENFAFNPFAFLQLPLTEECRSYKVKTIRAGSFSDTQTGTCEGTPIGSAGEGKIDYSNFQISGGINIIYKPWDLSVNISAPFIRFAVEEGTDQDSTIITFSKSFGNYRK
ncbi:MAG: hypothetical protein HN509_17745 [Halobacteriovoraceae bacterium]|jgi:hypothetical protein|nr:hypothetical protein [Halobacteriovoraceae bacterium]MBT5093547.1 hypothetical protein [Halobacteriovoraceae bacterium]